MAGLRLKNGLCAWVPSTDVSLSAGVRIFRCETLLTFYPLRLCGKCGIVLSLRVDPKKNPKTIDNAHETGQDKGKTQYGIYKLEGDKWIVCMTPPGAADTDRPKSFDTKGTKNVVFIFELVKEERKQ